MVNEIPETQAAEVQIDTVAGRGMRPTKRQLRGMFACPSCRSRASERCRAYASGNPVEDHPARVAVFAAYLRGLEDASLGPRAVRALLGGEVVA